MRKVRTVTSEFIILWKQSSVNAFEGALFGAFVGPIFSLTIACVIWLMKAGLFAGLPAGQHIAFSLGMGIFEGALFGAMLALAECALNRNLCLNPLPQEKSDR